MFVARVTKKTKMYNTGKFNEAASPRPVGTKFGTVKYSYLADDVDNVA